MGGGVSNNMVACLEVECLLSGVGDVQRHSQDILGKVHLVA